ncbi:MAG: peptidoglycan DD-metalloendopeptidase family protein [Elusimicrobiaceae bacterium]|nr:peptidoglycan DD-metalloendopeptidase family protein [Elusimicrobiaceae bacterium]
MERNPLVFLLLSCFLLSPAAAQDAQTRREELRRIQAEVDARRKKLDLYKKQEQDINRYISFLDKQKNTTLREKNDLNRRIGMVRRNIAETRGRQKVFATAQQYWRSVLAGEIAEYAVREASEFRFYGEDRLVSRLFVEAAIFNKIALHESLESEKASAVESAETLEKKDSELSIHSKALSKEEAVRRRKYEAKLSELHQTRDNYKKTMRELDDLRASAQSLVNFLEKFEASANAALRKKKITSSGEIPLAGHSLPWPVEGDIVGSYGREPVPALKTWIKRDGIIISAERGTPVLAVAPGSVIYSGPFRSYGNVVIVSHDDSQYFTVYGFLEDIMVARGTAVNTGAAIARAGLDTMTASLKQTDAKSAVYFEIRAGTRAVDPVKWLKKSN